MKANRQIQWGRMGWGLCLAISTGFFAPNVSRAMPNPPAKQISSSGSPHEYSIRIDLKKPVLRLYAQDRLICVYPVALGKQESETPIGEWHIVSKQENWGKGFGTRWMGFDVPWGTFGIHGTNRPESIGHYASHGCIRMRNSDVEALYERVPMGTTVIITGNPLAHYRTLEYGNIGADVRIVQMTLQKRGFYRGKCDGRFGPGMSVALAFFELAKRLRIDGVVGLDDYEALGLRPFRPSSFGDCAKEKGIGLNR